MTESKQKLLELEKENLYLFHGSSEPDIKELEPRQGYTLPREKSDLIKDGEPAIAATPYTEIAIFRALVRKGRSSFSASTANDGKISVKFKAEKKAIDAVKDGIGYVYVLSRDGFIPRSGNPCHMEWRCPTPVKPLFVFPVRYEDMPNKIECEPISRRGQK